MDLWVLGGGGERNSQMDTHTPTETLPTSYAHRAMAVTEHATWDGRRSCFCRVCNRACIVMARLGIGARIASVCPCLLDWMPSLGVFMRALSLSLSRLRGGTMEFCVSRYMCVCVCVTQMVM